MKEFTNGDIFILLLFLLNFGIYCNIKKKFPINNPVIGITQNFMNRPDSSCVLEFR